MQRVERRVEGMKEKQDAVKKESVLVLPCVEGGDDGLSLVQPQI